LTKKKIVIGTRGSKLAILQAKEVINELKRVSSEYQYELKIIKTHGDKFKTIPVHKLGRKGVFVKEIDKALLKGEIDISVHSMKDLPSEIPEGICIGAVPKRKSYKDAIYSKENKSLTELNSDSIIGTGSFRRKSQILSIRKDVKIKNIRGNIDTRIKKVNNGEYDAIVLAKAGGERLNLKIKLYELPDFVLPAAGQGALAVETCSNNQKIKNLIKKINHTASYFATLAEMHFIKIFGGGCRVPVGVLGEIKNNKLHITGEIIDLEGNERIKDSVSGNPRNYKTIAFKLCEKIKNQGGFELLKQIKENLKEKGI